jgi:hypothetical protein
MKSRGVFWSGGNVACRLLPIHLSLKLKLRLTRVWCEEAYQQPRCTMQGMATDSSPMRCAVRCPAPSLINRPPWGGHSNVNLSAGSH